MVMDEEKKEKIEDELKEKRAEVEAAFEAVKQTATPTSVLVTGLAAIGAVTVLRVTLGVLRKTLR
jgi:hypothetical protein